MKSSAVKEMMESGEELPFFPIEKGNQVIIPIPTDDTGTDMDSMTLAVLSAFKYRLSIGKSYLPKISRIIVSTPEIDYKGVFTWLNHTQDHVVV